MESWRVFELEKQEGDEWKESSENGQYKYLGNVGTEERITDTSGDLMKLLLLDVWELFTFKSSRYDDSSAKKIFGKIILNL